MRPIPLLILTIALISFSLSSAGAQNLVRIGIDKKEPALHYLPLIMAEKNGYFERHNINADITPYENVQDLIDDLKNETIDFAISGPLFSVMAVEFDRPIRILGVLTQGSVYYGFSHDPTLRDLDSFSPLKEGTIAIYDDDHPLTYHMTDYMRDNQADLENIKVKPFPPQKHADLIRDETVTIAIESEPQLTALLQNRDYVRTFAFDHLIGSRAFIVISANIERIKRNTAVAKDLMRALQESLVALLTDPNIAVSLADEVFPEYDRSVLSDPVRALLKRSAFPLSLRFEEQLWNKTITGLNESGYLLEKIGYEEAVDHRFIPEE